MAPPASTLPTLKICEILYALRAVQQPIVTITGFVASYLAYWHNALEDPIPIPFTVLIIACVVVLLQSHLFILFPEMQTHILLLKTSAPGFLLLSIGYGTLWAIPGIRGKEDDYFEPFRQTQGWKLADAGVEEHHKTLVRILITVGAVAVLVSAGVTGIGAHGVWKEKRRSGYAVVGLEEQLDMEIGDMDDGDEDEIPMKML